MMQFFASYIPGRLPGQVITKKNASEAMVEKDEKTFENPTMVFEPRPNKSLEQQKPPAFSNEVHKDLSVLRSETTDESAQLLAQFSEASEDNERSSPMQRSFDEDLGCYSFPNDPSRETNTNNEGIGSSVKIQVLQQKSMADSVLTPLAPGEDRSVIFPVKKNRGCSDSESESESSEDSTQKPPSKQQPVSKDQKQNSMSKLERDEILGNSPAIAPRKIYPDGKKLAKEPLKAIRNYCDAQKGRIDHAEAGRSVGKSEKHTVASANTRHESPVPWHTLKPLKQSYKTRKRKTRSSAKRQKYTKQKRAEKTSSSKRKEKGRKKKKESLRTDVDPNSKEFYAIDDILAEQEGLYLVKWKGWDISSSTWEPPCNLANCDEIVKRFRAKVKIGQEMVLPPAAPPAPILGVMESIVTKENGLYLVKWVDWSMKDSTWHTKEDLEGVGMSTMIEEFEARIQLNRKQLNRPPEAPSPKHTEVIRILED